MYRLISNLCQSPNEPKQLPVTVTRQLLQLLHNKNVKHFSALEGFYYEVSAEGV